ncbi:unnamed protein product [Coffea canephora]|uniref:DH200=94 genomic scaffold, scaffold_3436 n=1 Tax=Coffea canephora TaxID=49390 RepID=A0A068VL52_COFCA|nr:unnamed protein product [Coffea canephora]
MYNSTIPPPLDHHSTSIPSPKTQPTSLHDLPSFPPASLNCHLPFPPLPSLWPLSSPLPTLLISCYGIHYTICCEYFGVIFPSEGLFWLLFFAGSTLLRFPKLNMDCSTSTAKECATCTVPDPVIKASQAVVNIFVPKVDGQEKYSNVASGIIISEKGRILTYAPVVYRVLDYKIEVHLQNGQSYYAKVEWVDSFSSLAMISVVLKHWESKLPKVQVQYGTTRSVKSGDCVYACGCPAYLKNSLSVGTVRVVLEDQCSI